MLLSLLVNKQHLHLYSTKYIKKYLCSKYQIIARIMYLASHKIERIIYRYLSSNHKMCTQFHLQEFGTEPVTNHLVIVL